MAVSTIGMSHVRYAAPRPAAPQHIVVHRPSGASGAAGRSIVTGSWASIARDERGMLMSDMASLLNGLGRADVGPACRTWYAHGVLLDVTPVTKKMIEACAN